MNSVLKDLLVKVFFCKKLLKAQSLKFRYKARIKDFQTNLLMLMKKSVEKN